MCTSLSSQLPTQIKSKYLGAACSYLHNLDPGGLLYLLTFPSLYLHAAGPFRNPSLGTRFPSPGKSPHSLPQTSLSWKIATHPWIITKYGTYLVQPSVFKTNLINPSIGSPLTVAWWWTQHSIWVIITLAITRNLVCLFFLIHNCVSLLIHLYDFKIRTEENNQHTKHFLWLFCWTNTSLYT